LNEESWEKFYAASRDQKILGADYEDLIFRRVSKELGLDKEKTELVMKLFKAEQADVTKAIIDTCGGAAGFEKKKEELGKNWKTTYDEFRALREIIRQSRQGEYLRILNVDQLAVFSEHLRNTEIQIESSYGPEGVHYLISGAGKAK